MIAVERLPLAKWQSRRRELRNRVFGNDPNWAPYPKFIEKRVLDERHNPFWKSHHLTTLVGTRDGVVGCTVGLIVPNEPNAEPLWFGFFDAVFDQELVDVVMNELIEAARSAGGTGIMGPANMPKPIVDKLAAAIAQVLQMPDVREKLVTAVKTALTKINLDGITPFTVEAGTIGVNARALGAASLPLFANYMIDRDVLFKETT